MTVRRSLESRHGRAVYIAAAYARSVPSKLPPGYRRKCTDEALLWHDRGG